MAGPAALGIRPHRSGDRARVAYRPIGLADDEMSLFRLPGHRARGG